jgi:hypothetical protein
MKKIKKILVLSFLMIMLLSPMLVIAATDWTVGASGSNWSVILGSGGSGVGSGLPQGTILGIVSNILNWLLAILAAVSLIGFVIAGIMYLTAAGDETRAEKAKKAMMYSIIGVIVGLSGYVIFQAAWAMLNAQSF